MVSRIDRQDYANADNFCTMRMSMVPLIPCRCAPVAAVGRRQALQLLSCIVAAPQTLTASRSVAMASGDGGSDEQPKVGRCISCLYDFALALQGSHLTFDCLRRSYPGPSA